MTAKAASKISTRAWQRMLSGRRLDLLDPSPLDIEVADIAHGLARVARWNGQTSGAHIFSVAQHTLLVEAVMREHGEKILRIKGIANVIGVANPVVLHGVQELFHPPTMLDEWPSDDKRTRIVFIVCDVAPDVIGNTIPENFRHVATDMRVDA